MSKDFESWIEDTARYLREAAPEGLCSACGSEEPPCDCYFDDESPATSLARRKAEWQAEVLEEARGKHTGNRCYCAARIGKAAAALRRAEEKDNG